jgi:hypothetical protein
MDRAVQFCCIEGTQHNHCGRIQLPDKPESSRLFSDENRKTPAVQVRSSVIWPTIKDIIQNILTLKIFIQNSFS